MNRYLLSIGITFVILLIIAKITLIIKRIRINSRLERETKEELKRIKIETKKNNRYLKKINKCVEKISQLISMHRVSKTIKLFDIIKENYSKLSEENKNALSNEICNVSLGLFDEYFQEKRYNSARKVYDFLLSEVYPKATSIKKDSIYLELKNRYELLMSTGLYKVKRE